MKRKVWLIAGICVLMAVLIAGAVAGYMFLHPRYQLELTLEGEPIITLEYGSAFTDPGAHAQGHNTREPETVTAVSVERRGEVDTARPGIYRIQYIARYKNRLVTAYRAVHIVDTQKPVIELLTDPEIYTLPNQPYVEEGFIAKDGCDGDLTDRVLCKETDGVVTYTVTDSSGNTATVTRPVVYNDPVAPELTLLGESDLTQLAGLKYTDPGWTASDNADGDLTASVKVSGAVNIYLPGTYTLTYSVTDNWGNETSVTRQVTIKGRTPGDYDVVYPSGKVIYLTFDDGPSPYTSRLLDVLAQYNVKATFFVVHTGYSATLARMVAEGHTVGAHTATHKFSQVYASEEAYFADLEAVQSGIESATGSRTSLIRFPGGSSNSVSKQYNKGIMTRLTLAVEAMGYRYFDWTVDSKDAAGAKTADEVFDNVVRGVSGKSRAVVLQHDIHAFSVAAVERIIKWGLDNGYKFLPLVENSPDCKHPVFN